MEEKNKSKEEENEIRKMLHFWVIAVEKKKKRTNLSKNFSVAKNRTREISQFTVKFYSFVFNVENVNLSIL